MGFVLTEEQTMLKDAAADFMAGRLPVTALRDTRDKAPDARFDGATWKDMAEMGWAGVIVPEAHGGSGFGVQGLGVILEQQGRKLATTPVLQTALIGASAYELMGSEAQSAEWLPKIASGEKTFAFAVDEGAHHAPFGTKARVENGTLSGKKVFVHDGAGADQFLVLAKDGDALGLYRVAADADGVDVLALDTVDSRPAADIVFDGAVAERLERSSEDAIEALLDRARIGVAAELLGLAEAAFEMTGDYLRTRTQFGQLIGSFQALQHRAAIMFSELELTRSCVTAALSAVDDGANDIRELASLAKARAAETAHLVTNETVQMHGGIGMTDAHDSGLYLKRARVLEHLYGGETFHRDRYAKLNAY